MGEVLVYIERVIERIIQAHLQGSNYFCACQWTEKYLHTKWPLSLSDSADTHTSLPALNAISTTHTVPSRPVTFKLFQQGPDSFGRISGEHIFFFALKLVHQQIHFLSYQNEKKPINTFTQ